MCINFVRLYHFCVKINVIVNSAGSEDCSWTPMIQEMIRGKLSLASTFVSEILAKYNSAVFDLNTMRDVVKLSVLNKNVFTERHFDGLKRLVLSIVKELNRYELLNVRFAYIHSFNVLL